MTALPAMHRIHSVLAEWIPPGSDVAIVDVPVHRNAGDLFILAATRWFLDRQRCRIVYRAGIRDYSRRRAAAAMGPDTILVGLGGGNFGDLYPRYQRLREDAIAAFPRNRFVILPQSIHFASTARLHGASQRSKTHADLRIAVRDHRSLEAAHQLADHVELLPDVVDAFGPDMLAEMVPSAAPEGHGTVYLFRQDGEAAAHGSRQRHVDWPRIFPGLLPSLALAALAVPLTPSPARVRIYDWWTDYAHDLFVRGVDWMRTADHVVTDRLHAAILARLARRRVTLHDNSYGKLSAYYDAWWRDDPSVELRDRAPGPS